MRNTVLATVLCVALSCAALAQEAKEKWVYAGPNYAKDDEVSYMINQLLPEAKKIGCTHICTRDPGFGFIDKQPAHYIENIKKVRKAAEDLGLTMVPGVFPIGYSGGYLVHDANLSAGLPVRDAPFIVSGGVARPDPKNVPALINAGFDKVSDGLPEGWTVSTAAEGNVSADMATKHSGAASLREANVNTLPKDARATCIVSQTVAVKPFQDYVLSVWCKTANFSAGEFRLFLRSHDGARDHCYTNVPMGKTQDWKLCQFTFNTLDAEELSIGLGAEECVSGSIWWDDLKIEPAGFTNVLKSATKPFKVTNADGSVTYEEGKDYKGVVDPVLGDAPSADIYIKPFPYDVWHKGPDMTIPQGSRIKEGDTILVSYYHPHFIYKDQVSISMEDPKVFELMDTQMKLMHEAWGAKAYMLAYDEIRMGGWEVQPGGAHLTPGQELANHFKKAIEIARKYAPDAKLYTWSDMFDPNHNAGEHPGGYYLVNGDWTDSWEGLPKDIGVITWIPSHASLKWFSDRGNIQIMAGFYDGDVKSNVDTWMKVSKGIPGIEGMMYTTWSGNFSKLVPFFEYVDTFKGK
jgi:hypothetical protein